jgi:lysozyme family protein
VNVDQVIDGIIAREGGYVNDSRDAGGETNFGITAATARSSGYAGAMRDMPRDFAVEIYRRRYVVAPGFDKIVPISQAIAAELVDTGVNMGPKVAAGFLQRALNAFNNQGRDYADIVADGDVLLGGIATGLILFLRDLVNAIRSSWEEVTRGKTLDSLANAGPPSGEPQPVVVANAADNPVPTTET